MKKMGKFLYGIVFSFFVMMLCSCGVKNKGASVSLSVDIQESLQKNDFVFSRSIVDEELLLEVCLFDVDDNYKEYKVKTVSMVDGKAKVSFDKIPEGFNGVIEAKILYEEITLYEGKSDEFTVHPGKNVINLQLNKVKIDEKSKIAGIAKFENAAEHLGINVTLVSTDGLMTTDASAARGIATNARVVKDFVTTDKDGNYLFENVAAGVYTIYASSNSSTEKAILTNVVVSEEGGTITPSVLKLTATGSITGKITIDGSTDGVLGLDVFIAGTSFVAKVGSDGNYEISNIPAKKGYVLCVQKEKYTTTIKGDLEVKGNDTVKIDDFNLLSKDWEEGTVEQENPTFKWKGALESAPENPGIYWAYFNTKDGCSYIWNGSSWDLLAQAGKDGVFTGIYNTIENVIPKNVTLARNPYAENYQVGISLPYSEILPETGDKLTLKWEFTSDIDIKNLRVALADCSELVNDWKDLTVDYITETVNKNEVISLEKTLEISSKPIGNLTLIIRYNVEDTDVEANFITSSSSITLQRGDKEDSNNNIDTLSSQITCTVVEEGIKFRGNLLSNIVDSQAVCEIRIRDVKNNVTMYRNYTIDSNTYDEWEIIYPLVENGKDYEFEVVVADQATTICKKEFTVTAIGGLGEYKVENTGDYEVTLSEDKTKLSRTPQIFTDNPKVSNLILDYGTKYAVYSNGNEATTIWDGIWRHDTVYWQSSSNQICDLTNLGWPSYEELCNCLIGRRLGTRTETHIKLAGYTHNNTAYFVLNDYKETFFDWDDEETIKYFIMYRNPESNEYFTDVPGTSLYYIKVAEYGNVVFVDKNTEGAIPVYGKLINYGDKIYEPVYAPKFEHYTFTGDWKVYVGDDPNERFLNLPFNSNDLGNFGKCGLVVFEPVVNACTYVVTIQDESGTELCKINTNNLTFKISSSNVPVKQGYGLLYLQDSDGKQYNVNQIYECKKDLILTAKYEPLEVTFNVGDILFSDGTYIKAENVEYGIPESLKSKVMAVITNQTLEGKYLGVGIKKSDSIQWAPNGTTGYYEDFEGIKVDVTGGNWDGTSYSFTGDLDGSDNWEYICSVDPSASGNAEYNYPVFNFANNYGSYAGLEGTEYENGWYVPSIAELYDVYTNKITIQTSMNAAGGFDVESGWYWSSSQSASYYGSAYELDFGNGIVGNLYKNYDYNVLVLQAFNPKQFNNYNYGTPSITSVEIPTVGEGYSGEIPVTIKGKNFIGPNFDVNNLSCSGLNLDNVTKVNDSKITATVYCDDTAGEKSFTVSYGSSSVNGILKVVEAEKCFSVGDIILTDGTKVSVAEVSTYTIDESNKPIGVVASALYGGGVGKAVGLQKSASSLKWAPSGTGYNTNFTGIQATSSGDTSSGYTFSGDIDGSDNWEYICSIDPEGTKDAATNYPIFNFANTYGTTAGLTDTEYETGWYVPSVAEVYEVYKNKDVIQTSLDAASGFTFGTSNYWSSSQYGSDYDDGAYHVGFGDGGVYGDYKNNNYNVFVLQALTAK